MVPLVPFAPPPPTGYARPCSSHAPHTPTQHMVAKLLWCGLLAMSVARKNAKARGEL